MGRCRRGHTPGQAFTQVGALRPDGAKTTKRLRTQGAARLDIDQRPQRSNKLYQTDLAVAVEKGNERAQRGGEEPSPFYLRYARNFGQLIIAHFLSWCTRVGDLAAPGQRSNLDPKTS
jgi:hypothetical protein